MANELAALLAGNAPLPDPNLAPITQELQTAQGLTAQSLSGQPVYRNQAIANVFSGLAGAYLKGEANRDLTRYASGGIDAVSRSLPANHSLQPLLQSKNPFVQQIGMRGVPEALKQLGETKDLRSGNILVSASGQPLAANTGTAAATAEEKKTPELVKRAGQTAAAEAAGKAAVEYGDLAQPPAAVPKGPGFTEPLKTERGTMVPALSDQAQLPKSPKELDAAIPNWQKKKDEWSSSIIPGYQAEMRLGTIANAFKSFQSGSYATEKAQIAGALKGVGINLPESVFADPAKVQLALHENYIETIQQLKAANNRWTQMEFKALSANREHPNLQPEANLQMLGEDIGTLRHARDVATDFNQAQKNGWRDPQSFEAAWSRINPLSEYAKRAKEEIGPLKGMPGAGAAGSNPNEPGGVSRQHVRVSTPEDARRLPKGTPILLPDGRSGVVP
jgi:hypothetical protein